MLYGERERYPAQFVTEVEFRGEPHPEAMAAELPKLDHTQPLDWDRIARGGV